MDLEERMKELEERLKEMEEKVNVNDLAIMQLDKSVIANHLEIMGLDKNANITQWVIIFIFLLVTGYITFFGS